MILPFGKHKGICLCVLQGNTTTSMQVNSTGIQGGNFPTVRNNLECPVACETQKPLQQPISPSRFSQMSLQPSQPSKGSPQPAKQTDSQLQTPLHSDSDRRSKSSTDQQHDHQVCLNSCFSRLSMSLLGFRLLYIGAAEME